jgi:hypothetical protein
MSKSEKRTMSEEVTERLEAGMKRLSELAEEQRRLLEKNEWVAKLKSGELRKEFDTRFETLRTQVLDRVGLATREDLDKLAKKLTSLAKRVTELGNNKNAA